MQKRNLKQHCVFKFHLKLNENSAETSGILKWAYGELDLSKAQVLGGIKHFGWRLRVCVEDKPCSGRPCTSKTEENVTKVRAAVMSDRHLAVRMISS
jgi:hypothetical protein